MKVSIPLFAITLLIVVVRSKPHSSEEIYGGHSGEVYRPSGYGGYNRPYGNYGGYNRPGGYGNYNGGYNGGYNRPYNGYNRPYGGYNRPYGGSVGSIGSIGFPGFGIVLGKK